MDSKAIEVTDGIMEKKHKDILNQVLENLVNDMDPNNILLKMASTNIFTDDHKEQIKAKDPNRRQQCELLLDILVRRGDRAYKLFKNALEEDHPHLANEIYKAEKKSLKSELTRERINSANLRKREGNQTCSRCQESEKEIKALQKQMETLQKENDNKATEIINLLEKEHELRCQIEISDKEKTEIEYKRNQIQKELETSEQRVDHETRKKIKVGREKDNLVIKFKELTGEVKKLNKKLTKLENAEPEPDPSSSPSSTKFKELLISHSSLKSKNEELSLELTKEQDKCNELEKETSLLNKKNKELSLELSSIQNNSEKLLAKCRGLEERISSERISSLSKRPTQQDLDDERESHQKKLDKFKSEGDKERTTLEKRIKDKDTQIRALEKDNAKLQECQPAIIKLLQTQVETFTELSGKLSTENKEIKRKWDQTIKQLNEKEMQRKKAVQREQHLKKAVLHPSIFLPSKKSYYSRGVVHALNTRSSAILVATRSSEGQGNARDIFNRKNITTSGTKEEEDSWWCVDLGQDNLLAMTHYALRHGNREGEAVLSKWKIEGSNDGNDFIEIETYEKIDNPPRYRGPDEYAPGRWSVNCEVGAFRYFRISQTGKNSSNKYGIYLSGVELYGVLFRV